VSLYSLPDLLTLGTMLSVRVKGEYVGGSGSLEVVYEDSYLSVPAVGSAFWYLRSADNYAIKLLRSCCRLRL